jgi:hypothetical protein
MEFLIALENTAWIVPGAERSGRETPHMAPFPTKSRVRQQLLPTPECLSATA